MGFLDSINNILMDKQNELLDKYKVQLKKLTNDQLINELDNKLDKNASMEVIYLIQKEMQKRGLE